MEYLNSKNGAKEKVYIICEKLDDEKYSYSDDEMFKFYATAVFRDKDVILQLPEHLG